MATYRELQKQAKEKGLKYVGVSKEDLILALQKESHAQDEADAENTTPEEVENQESVSDESEDTADAVVYHGKNRVRVYTLEQHGENYKELAQQFVDSPKRDGHRIEFETVETRITCPHCGQKFRRY